MFTIINYYTLFETLGSTLPDTSECPGQSCQIVIIRSRPARTYTYIVCEKLINFYASKILYWKLKASLLGSTPNKVFAVCKFPEETILSDVIMS